MSQNTFAITTTTQEVLLSPQQQGSIVFTVFNASGHAILPARAEIATEQPEAQDWVTLEGSAEKNFAEGGTQQYTINVQVPANAAAGQYSFRLNMIGVENPDEDFTQGPGISFTVPEKQTPPASESKIPWLWIALGAVGFLAVAGFLIWFMTKSEPESVSEKISLQNYVGDPLGNLEIQLEDAGFNVNIREQFNPDYQQGIIFDQEPKTGEYDTGTKVRLFVSQGPQRVQLQNVEGFKFTEAEEKLKAKGFKVSAQKIFHNSKPKDEVISQEPSAGGYYYPPETSVTLQVSKGAQQSPFVGTWVNQDTNTRGMTRLIIKRSNGNAFTLQGFGSCSPQDCDWDETNGVLSGNAISGIWDFGFKTTKIKLSLSGQKLKVTTYDDYNDNRTNRNSKYTFVKQPINPLLIDTIRAPVLRVQPQ